MATVAAVWPNGAKAQHSEDETQSLRYFLKSENFIKRVVTNRNSLLASVASIRDCTCTTDCLQLTLATLPLGKGGISIFPLPFPRFASVARNPEIWYPWPIFMPRSMTRTWRFDVNLQMAVLSPHEEVSDLFKQILDTANDRIHIGGLETLSFSYDLPEDGIAKISGYLHVNKTSQLPEAAVREWIVDDRIIGEVEWTPVFPGINGDWRQHSLIRYDGLGMIIR